MRTIVTKDNLEAVKAALGKQYTLIWDVETNGLNSYHQARMFSLAIADLFGNSWYFNFKPYPEMPDYLEPSDIAGIMHHKRTWIAHNAKFDMHFCAKDGICPVGEIVDTKALARLYENHHHPWVKGGGYSLDACAKRWLEQEKDDRVKEWMDEHQAYSSTPGVRGKNYHFDLVPFDIISEYAMIDAEVTAKLYGFLMQNMYETPMLKTEIELTSVLFHMERTGVLIDREYCLRAQNHESKRLLEALTSCAKEMPSGVLFKDHASTLAPIFRERGFELTQTDLGNDQVTDKLLAKSDDPLAKALLVYRDAQKRMTTYWQNYWFLQDATETIHTSFDQSGTGTGRMSCRDPNLQNIPAEDGDSEFPVRRVFIARPGFKFVAMDYKAIEFRMALEYAGETELIDKIRQGHDPHQAAADLTGLTRKQAKVFNFAVLFGAGLGKISEMLACDLAEARSAKYNYFSGLPRLQAFISNATRKMESRGHVLNVYSRRLYTDDRKFAYKATNLIIQGSAADIMKRAMVVTDAYLRTNNYRSRLLLTIHDEIAFEVHDDEHHVIPHLKLLMEQAYNPVKMPMEVSIEIGPNLYDMEPYVSA